MSTSIFCRSWNGPTMYHLTHWSSAKTAPAVTRPKMWLRVSFTGGSFLPRRAELVSASIAPSDVSVRGDEWTLKQVLGDGCCCQPLTTFSQREQSAPSSGTSGKWRQQ